MAVLLLIALAATARPDDRPGAVDSLRADLGPVPDFALTERSGRTVRRDDLKGKVWVVAFIYTCCTEGCEKLADHMALLQQRLADCPDARLVCFSVHPEQDTPEALRAFADDKGAHAQRWLFLTGDEQEIYHLSEKGFRQYVKRFPDRARGMDVEHSFFFTVVDRAGRMRGIADGRKDEEVYRVEQRVRELLAEDTERPQVSVFPAINASLNGLCGVLLVLGFLAVRSHWITFHKVCMLTALAVSAIFLGCYLYYHFVVRDGRPTAFPGEGAVRFVYLGILLTHTVLAAAVAPMAIVTTVFGLRGTVGRHTRLARWTLPIWLYVSATGVVVYFMLYHLYPAH
jgi:protein SCO1/2/putative membrane protein